MNGRIEAAQSMADAAQAFYHFGWLLGTSGNLSTRMSPEHFLITGSGKNKGTLELDDFLLCDLLGKPVEETHLKPSAETLVHCVLYGADPNCGAIYHVHHLGAALCSSRDAAAGFTEFRDLEMIKGLGIWDRDRVRIPIVENHRHIPDLAAAIARIDSEVPGIMVLRHGFYAWGRDPFEARRHVESLAYLFDYSWAAG